MGSEAYLQDVEFGALNAGSETCDFGLDTSVDFFDLKRMDSRLVANSTCVARSMSMKSATGAAVNILSGYSSPSMGEGERTFFQVQIEPDSRGRPGNLLPQPLFELLYICHETFILALHQGEIISLQQLKF